MEGMYIVGEEVREETAEEVFWIVMVVEVGGICGIWDGGSVAWRGVAAREWSQAGLKHFRYPPSVDPFGLVVSFW